MKTAHSRLYRVAVVLVIFAMLLPATFVFSAAPVLAQKEPPQDPTTGQLPLDDPAEGEVEQAAPETDALLAEAQQNGGVGIIVVLKTAESNARVNAAAQDAFLQSMAAFSLQNVYRYHNFPMVAMRADAGAVQALLKNPLVEAVQEDAKNTIHLQDSTIIVGAVDAAQAGYTGTGVTVAIIDTGVDKTHSFLSGKVVSEACFSTGNGLGSSLCPNHDAQQYGPGAGVNCTGLNGCYHGTHVAGIAAGSGATFSGVARGANIIAINVFTDYYYAGNHYLYSFDSDMIKALDYVYSQHNTYNISSVNMSIGGGKYTGYCDKPKAATKKAIDRLRAVNIATVISSGNDQYINAMSSPGCISSAVSVGSTDKSDQVSYYSNSASFLSLLAPGQDIYSSVPGGWDTLSGTSMAAPHVTGAWAVLRQAFPTKTVSAILALLKTTGVPVKDQRNGKVKPRINIAYAIAQYQKPGTAPDLYSPSEGATITNSTPELSWYKLPWVSKYRVTVKKNAVTTVYSKLIPADTVCRYDSEICTLHIPNILPTAAFTWTVQPFSGAGGGPVSAPRTFYTPVNVPSPVSLTYPVDGIGYYSPNFTWDEVAAPYAAKYLLRIYLNGVRILNKTYEAIKICSGGYCQVTKPKPFVEGDYTWEIIPWNPVGYGLISGASFDYHANNGLDNHFDTDLTGITTLYPKPYYWWLNSSNLTTWYGNYNTWASMRMDSTYSDIDFTAVIKRTGSTSPTGILIRGAATLAADKDWKSSYSFLYSNNGYFSVWKTYNYRDYSLQSYTYTAAINQNGFNTLRVIANGSYLSFYINGTLVWTGYDTAPGPLFTKGSAGVESYLSNTWNNDYLYIDRVTTAPMSMAGSEETVSPEQQALNDAAMANPAGSKYGLDISPEQAEFLKTMPAMPEITIEQRMLVCLATGDACALPFPH